MNPDPNTQNQNPTPAPQPVVPPSQASTPAPAPQPWTPEHVASAQTQGTAPFVGSEAFARAAAPVSAPARTDAQQAPLTPSPIAQPQPTPLASPQPQPAQPLPQPQPFTPQPTPVAQIQPAQPPIAAPAPTPNPMANQGYASAPAVDPFSPAPTFGTPAYAPAPAGKKGLPKVAKILIAAGAGFVVIAIIAVTLFLTFFGNATRQAQNVSDQVMNAIQADDSDAVYALATSDFKKVTTKASLTAALREISPLLRGEESVTDSALASSGGESYAVFVYGIKTDDGTKYVKITEKNDDNKWLVQYFRASDTSLKAELDKASDTTDGAQ